MSHEGVVIFGMPRSGTTLLRRLFDAHPRFSAPGETHLLSACARFLQHEQLPNGTELGVVRGLSFLGIPESTIEQHLRNLVFEYRRRHAKREGKPRWVEKTVFDVAHLDTLAGLLDGEVEVIRVYRHGLDVVCSLLDLEVEYNHSFAMFRRYFEVWVGDPVVPAPLGYARAWADYTSALTALHAQMLHVHTVRYEDLVLNTNAVMSTLMFELGETWKPEYVRQAFTRDSKGFSDWKHLESDGVYTTSVDRWHQVEWPDLVSLARFLDPVLVECGYDPVGRADVPRGTLCDER